MTQDLRITAIRSWLENDLKRKIKAFAPASADASFRRYFRVTDQYGTHIIMDAPPETENTEAFIKIAHLFSSANINVPDILEHEQQQGFLLLQDFGSESYLDKLTEDNGDFLYQAAFLAIQQIQKLTILPGQLPQYDAQLLGKELGIFEQWFLNESLSVSLDAAAKEILKQTWAVLIDSALEQPQICVHRDFHSRNLMYLNTNNPGIIDFQDAVLGPITYDLVSLLKDCYISWPASQVQAWATLYFDYLLNNEQINCDAKQFLRWFDLMGMQRHLKAIGIFSRLKLRDNKPNYIKDIPRTLCYIKQVSARYQDLQAFNKLLSHIVSTNPQFNL